jgi:GH35 family endo-1,4-beta-xylanase
MLVTINYDCLIFFAVLISVISCKKSDSPASPPPPPLSEYDTSKATSVLKNAAAFHVGLAVDYTQYMNDAAYAAVVAREANNITLGYHMKHGAIVKNDGSFDFVRTDEMVNKASAAGLSINSSKAGIDDMFIKLAATGLKVKISELDIRVNPSNTVGFVPSQTLLNEQAAMYRYVLQSYYSNVPAAERYGVTVWGVSDNFSWIVVSQGGIDSPLLFDQAYNKKPGYTGLWLGFRQQ